MIIFMSQSICEISFELLFPNLYKFIQIIFIHSNKALTFIYLPVSIFLYLLIDILPKHHASHKNANDTRK